MITVHMVKHEGVFKEFEVTGHARYDKYGNDIVCSAVSAVVYTVLGALGDLAGVHQYEDVQSSDGNDYIKFELPGDLVPDRMQTARILMETLFIGVKQIEDRYGKYLKVRVQEV